jgi:uncharacterized membrane protein YraQ (UPF0718 family)/YHS domain-containing protein
MWAVDGLTHAFQMLWEVWWALVLGFGLSAVVQAWVPRARLERTLGGRGLREVSIATGLGAASSSCSYAAIAIAKSLFARGASLVSAITFQFASTNLVFELGLVLWLFLGWRFTLAEFVGGIVLILLTWAALVRVVSPRAEEAARRHAEAAESGHVHHTAGSGARSVREKLTSVQAWSDVAHNFRGDWTMLWKEILAGFVIAGYISTLPMTFFNGLFLTNAWAPLRIAENAVVGPIVAALAFVCSIGNIPLAAVLWSGGISFAGVIGFIYADLIIVPIVIAYRKYYGGAFALRLVAVMAGAMIAASLVVDGLFSLVGLVPSSRPSVASVAERPITWNYTSLLDLVFLVVFAVLIGLTWRRGAKDPVCGMTVDRHAGQPTAAHGGRTVFFCSAHCKSTFDKNPEAYA